MTKEEIDSAIEHLWNLHSALQRLCITAVRKGLRKKAFLENQFKGFEANKERILDLIQWMEYSTNDTEMAQAEQMVSSGLKELHCGDTITVN